MALQASSCLRWRALFTSGIAPDTPFTVSSVARGALREAFSAQEESSETRLACVNRSNTCSAWCLARGTLEIHTGKAIVATIHTLSLREEREVAVLLAGYAICR